MFWTGYQKVSWMHGKSYKKHVPIPERFGISCQGTRNMERCKNDGMASMLWKHVLPFQHLMCTKIQHANDC